MRYLTPQRKRSWSEEDVFSKEPIRRFALALISNQAFLDSKLKNPFHYQKHGLNGVTVYRNGYPIAGTPLSTDDEKRLYKTTMDAFVFGYHGHGTPFTNYTDHFCLFLTLQVHYKHLKIFSVLS